MKALSDILKAWPDTWKAFVGAFDTPVDRRKYEKEPKDTYAIDAVKRMHELNDSMSALIEQGDGDPDVWFVTAFDDASMEHKRAMRGERPSRPFIEPSMDNDKEVRIARLRHDGVKLYWRGPNQGSWIKKAEWGASMSRDEAEKKLEIIEYMAGKPGYYGHTHSCCFGMYFSEKAALTAVHNNAGDMQELLYTWLVIQKVGEGVDGFDNDGQIWFKWDYNETGSASNSIADRGKWVKIPRPEETKYIVSFSPVG